MESRTTSYCLSSCVITREDVKMLFHNNRVCARAHACSIIELAALYWPKSLWETVSADQNLFLEHRPFVTVHTHIHTRARTHTHRCGRPLTPCAKFPKSMAHYAKTLREETAAFLLDLQMEERDVSVHWLLSTARRKSGSALL